MRSQLHKAVEGVSTLACESLNLSLWKFVETENHGPIFIITQRLGWIQFLQFPRNH